MLNIHHDTNNLKCITYYLHSLTATLVWSGSGVLGTVLGTNNDQTHQIAPLWSLQGVSKGGIAMIQMLGYLGFERKQRRRWMHLGL